MTLTLLFVIIKGQTKVIIKVLAMSIEITKLEMQLILEEAHPEYNSSFEDEYVERGKGADVHYERKVIRLSDNKELRIGFTHNSDVGIHDWLRGGDFTINSQKKDIYDVYGELLKEEAVEQVEETPKEPTIFEKHKAMMESGELPDFDSDSWLNVPVEKLMHVVDLCRDFMKKQSNEKFTEISRACITIGLEEKVNGEKIFKEIFNNTKVSKSRLGRKRIEAYFLNRRELAKNPNHLMTLQQVKDLQDLKPHYLKI